jgi:thiol-disulfide isomerase/thioredoxin
MTVEVRTAADTVARFARVSFRLDDDTTPRLMMPTAPGEFQSTLAASATHATLVVTVPDHSVIEARVLLPRERPAHFVVRPRALIPRDSMPRPRVVGDFNGFATAKAVPMLSGADGRLRADVPFTGTSARFLILGVGGPDDGVWMPVSSYAVAPDSSDGVRFAGVHAPERDTLHFVLDPRAMTQAYRRAAEIQTRTADSAVSLVNQLVLERRDAMLVRLVLSEMRPADVDTSLQQAIANARALTNPAQDPRVRSAAYVSLMSFNTMGAPRPVQLAREFLMAIPPGSVALRDRDAVSAVSRAVFFSDTTPYTDAADSTRRTNSRRALQQSYLLPVARDMTMPRTVRAAAYSDLIFGSLGITDQSSLDAFIDEAVAAIPEDPSLKEMPASFGRLRVLRVGAPFPTFTMRALGDTLTAPISNASFRGKVTLVDFWGMWCAPCVAEMPVLHAAFGKYASRGFMIVSIDTDSDLDRVAAFRKAKWPMPWLHGWARGGPMSPALRALGVIGFPTAVLVDREGRVLAVDAGLRGAALDATLARLLP